MERFRGGASFSFQLCGGNSQFAFGLHQSRAKLEFLEAIAFLNKSILFGKLSYVTFFFISFLLHKGTVQINNINNSNKNV